MFLSAMSCCGSSHLDNLSFIVNLCFMLWLHVAVLRLIPSCPQVVGDALNGSNELEARQTVEMLIEVAEADDVAFFKPRIPEVNAAARGCHRDRRDCASAPRGPHRP